MLCNLYKKERTLSLPSRERGLKLLSVSASKKERCVAPLAGAWIEICATVQRRFSLSLSLPSRERGLKCQQLIDMKKDLIESLPSRERGLKSGLKAWKRSNVWSLPSRERGLKCHFSQGHENIRDVAPLAGAWIEMTTAFNEPSDFAVAPLAGAWIEI